MMKRTNMAITNPGSRKRRKTFLLIISVIIIIVLSYFIYITVTEATPLGHEINFYIQRKLAYLEGYFETWIEILTGK